MRVRKLNKAQQAKMHTQAYNQMYNELFKLHKYLVECDLSPHSVGEGNPVDDAIKLIEELRKH